MARVKLLEKDEVDPTTKDFYEKSVTATGRVLNLFKVLAHSPKICRDWNRMGTTILRKCKLDPKIRQIAIIRVGEHAQAQYELTAHRGIGLQTGLTQAQVDDIADWKGSENFSDQELTILEFTDQVVLDYKATDETYAKISEFLSPQEIVELTVTIGFYGMVTRTLETFQIDMEK